VGTIRTVLALSVVLWHIGPGLAPLSGEAAVTCFYIISGFYMSMIINERYHALSPWRFYMSRAMRLLPAYWVALLIAACTIVANGDTDWLLNSNHTFKPIAWLAMVASNVAIVGLDIVNFLVKSGFSHQTLIRLVGPAWTLGIELQFYVVAPFIVARSPRLVMILLVATLTLHFSLLGLPPAWHYYFGPASWCFFILGVVAHRLSSLLSDNSSAWKMVKLGLPLLLIAAIVAEVWRYEETDAPSLWAFYLLFAALVPSIFAMTKTSVVDNAVGGLSYPIYLVHFPLISAFATFFRGSVDEIYQLGFWRCAALITTTIGVSAILHYAVERPVDRIRNRLRSHATPTVRGKILKAGA
jgi:peptidoglycan/LPS O-acetylase OafA/YrhL